MLVKPSVHLNGTSAEELLNGYAAAFSALSAARDKLALTAPHGRDYYVQPDDAIAAATEQHVRRMQRLTAVIHEIETLAMHVSDHVVRKREGR